MSYIGYYEDCCNSDTPSFATNKYNIIEKNSDFVAEKFNFYSVTTLNNSVEVSLPTDVQNGDWVGFIDRLGTFANNNLVIKYNNIATIKNNSGDLIVDVNGVNFKLVYNNGNWFIFDMSFTAGDAMGGGSSGGSGYELFEIVHNTSDFVATKFKYHSVSTNSGIVNVTLPSNPVSGDWIGFIDPSGSFAINNLIIKYSGVPIRSNSGDLIVDVGFINFKLVYDNNNWLLLDYSAAVAAGESGTGSIALQGTQGLQGIQGFYGMQGLQGPAGIGSGTSSLSYTVYDVSGIVNTVINGYYLINTLSSIATINLPSNPSSGDWVIISDKNGTFGINKAVLKYSSHTILRNNGDVEIDYNNAKLKLVYYNNNWDILNLS